MRKICTPCCGPSDCYCYNPSNPNPEYLQMAIQASGDMAWLNGVNVPLKQDSYSDFQLINGINTDVSGFHNYFGVFTAIRPSSEYDIQPTGIQKYRLFDCQECYPFWLANLQCISGQSNLFLYNNLGDWGIAGGNTGYLYQYSSNKPRNPYTLRYQFIKGERPTCGSEYQITFDQTKLVNQFWPQTTVSGLINVDITSDYDSETFISKSGFIQDIYWIDREFNLIGILEYDINRTGYYADFIEVSYTKEMNPGQHSSFINDNVSTQNDLDNYCVNTSYATWQYSGCLLKFKEIYPQVYPDTRYTNIWSPTFTNLRSDIYNSWMFECTGQCNVDYDFGPYYAGSAHAKDNAISFRYKNGIIYNNSYALPSSGLGGRGWNDNQSGFFISNKIHGASDAVTVNATDPTGYFDFYYGSPPTDGFFTTDSTLAKNAGNFSNKFRKTFLDLPNSCQLPITGVHCYITSHSVDTEHVGTYYNCGYGVKNPQLLFPHTPSNETALQSTNLGSQGLVYAFRYSAIDFGFDSSYAMLPLGGQLLASGLLFVSLGGPCDRNIYITTQVHSEYIHNQTLIGFGVDGRPAHIRSEVIGTDTGSQGYSYYYNMVTDSGVINSYTCEPFYLNISFPVNHLIPNNWINFHSGGFFVPPNFTGTLNFEISE